MASQFKFDGYLDANTSITLLSDVEDIEVYSFNLPAPPKPEFISNFGLPFDQQFFQREKVPRKIWELTSAVNNQKITREEAFVEVNRNAELSSFIQSQWHKREFGDWVYIRGKPTYITGQYWFYLNYYLLDIGHPSYRETDCEEHQCWKYCVEENSAVYGMIKFERRRSGKTYRAGNMLVEYATRTEKRYVGLQSKSEEDGETFFRKAVVYQFKRLPFFFQPEHERVGKMKKSIELISDNIDNSFETILDYKSTTPTAYDGQKLGRGVGDEFGKMVKPANPIDIWDKNKYCFFNDGEIIGKYLICTTCEEMLKGGGEQFKYLWDRSSRIKKDGQMNEYGETRSGLVPYFTPAYKNIFFDQYGQSVIDEPKPYQKLWRKAKGDKFWNIGGKEYIDKQIASAKDGKDRQDVIRKLPRTIREAFRYNNTSCLYDIDVINKRIEFFFGGAESIYPSEYPMTYGYFRWVKGKDFQQAEFIATSEKEARIHIRYMPPPDQRNRWHLKNGKQCPSNTTRFNAGCDPFKLKTEQVVHKDRMSLGAGHVFALLDPSVDGVGKPREEWLTDNFVAEYLFRPETPDLFAEDMAMMCIFYGCKVFPENNIDVVDRKFRDWGLDEYLQFRHKTVMRGNMAVGKEDRKLAGAYNIEAYKPTLIRYGMNYILEKGMYMPFPRTLEAMRDMSYENFTDYDLGVSCLFTLVGTFDQPKQKDSVNKVNYGKDIPIPQLRTYGKRA
jgi:hypothetical protein